MSSQPFEKHTTIQTLDANLEFATTIFRQATSSDNVRLNITKKIYTKHRADHNNHCILVLVNYIQQDIEIQPRAISVRTNWILVPLLGMNWNLQLSNYLDTASSTNRKQESLAILSKSLLLQNQEARALAFHFMTAKT